MTTSPNPSPDLIRQATITRQSAKKLARTSNQERQQSLLAMAAALEQSMEGIIKGNEIDLKQAENQTLQSSLIARLKLDREKMINAIEGIRQVAALPDPLNHRQLHIELDEDLILERLSTPLGVVGVIFEARPDAVMQIASLAIRSGNGAILKGGREATISNQVILKVLHQGLTYSCTDVSTLHLLTTREESLALLNLESLVDLIIPRGSNQLVRFIKSNTKIPVLGHADGICHLYIDQEANIDQAITIALDSKTQHPSACNAIETLLIHEKIGHVLLPKLIPVFESYNVELRGDPTSCTLGIIKQANENDWSTEYSDLILSVKIVPNINEALAHINKYGSRHTDAIVTDNLTTANLFLDSVDSAGVYLNCSTRFADGFRYGFGAEVGISTQTLPPRGPVGLEGLVTYRYVLRGKGHISSDYISGVRQFTHRSLAV
ncbi:gamma-glutamyl phosphate reductase (chromatophore) [Paulinella micropora]|uniref:glutamate-5-semialdehyde dehydrogenase n=1 Tax=Paulinella micropora TaxID=1928728 RepID=A0A1L5YD26_9EUKA|nr:gamma-glutamyl phosphate reductase [Paulinella micropora]AQX45379.1 gamma-glutamyl phosphate reductase [Paulinella micropora]BBL86599.1 gamma-glutamyl phosphate reductase [Paulinella micropora]